MLEIHFTQSDCVHEQLNKLLSGRLHYDFEISRTENGKPYIEGNPLFFNISHSGSSAVIALCDRPVGIDLQVLSDKTHDAVISRMCESEQSEIGTCQDFLRHWVVREAYVKMLGSTLAEKLRHLNYIQGKLYDCGKQVSCQIITEYRNGCILAVCIDKRS